MPRRTRRPTNTSYWLFFAARHFYFLSGEKTIYLTLRIVVGCKNILDKCIDVETNLSVDTPEFRESEWSAFTFNNGSDTLRKFTTATNNTRYSCYRQSDITL